MKKEGPSTTTDAHLTTLIQEIRWEAKTAKGDPIGTDLHMRGPDSPPGSFIRVKVLSWMCCRLAQRAHRESNRNR
jgi:hypothetical protein